MSAVVEEDGSESRCSLDSRHRSIVVSDSQQADGGGGLSGLCVVINNETVRIRSISVKITGLQATVAKQAAVEVNLTTVDGAILSAELPPTSGKTNKKSFLSKIIKKSKSTRRDSADKAGVSAAAAVSAEAAAAVFSGSSADASTGVEKQKQEQLPVQVPSGADGLEGNRDGSDQASSTGSEISVPPRDEGRAKVAVAVAKAAAAAVAAAAATAAGSVGSASNTVESETVAETSTGDAPVCTEKAKPSKMTLSSLLSRRRDKSKGSTDQLSFNFPSDLPDNVKKVFQIMSDTRLIATVYTSNAGRTAAVKKQKTLMTEGAEKRFTVDGKPRSVWLDPPAGEQVEIWKEYFGDDGECNRALGRLPGTDKYGYILPDEVDPDKEFATPEEKEDYKETLEKLVMFQNLYGNDDDEQYA